MILSGWSDEDPNRVYRKLKKFSHYYNTRERTVADLWSDLKVKGVSATFNERQMWNQMRMSDSDLSDVTGMNYTFLMNGQSPDSNWTGLFKRGEKIRLRFINAVAMSIFDVRIPGVDMQVIAADGQNVEPVTIGTTTMHEQHQDEMIEHISSGHMTMTDKGRGSVTIMTTVCKPWRTERELTWTFDKAENLEFTCNVLGHYQSGMVGSITVQKYVLSMTNNCQLFFFAKY